jgi:hypothetical protein
MSELPEGEELNELICALAEEKDIPQDVYSPNLVELDTIPGHIYGLTTEQGRGIDMYRRGQEWRRRLLAELRRRPAFVAEWRTAQDLNARIKALCAAKRYQFMPWEMTPWQVHEDTPPPDGGWAGPAWQESYPKAQRLRRQLLAELEGEGG